MSIKSWNLLIVGSLLFVLAMGGGILYFDALKKQARIEFAQAQQEKQVKQKAQVQRQVLADVETFLNGFLKEVSSAAAEYKKNREVLTGLVKPENMASTEYITENASLGESTEMSLNMQIEKIMGLFGDADKKFKEILPRLSEADQKSAQKKWEEVRTKQFDLFGAYFASEQDILKAYGELLQFYAVKRDVMSVEVANKKIMFTKSEDQTTADAIKAKISDLEKAQVEILKGPPQEAK